MAETVMDIFQRTQEVRQRGLLFYVGEGVSDEAAQNDPQLQELQESLGGFSTEELAELIFDEASDYSSHAVGRRLAVMVKRFITLEDAAATELLTAGPVTVTRREKSRAFAIADLTGDEPRDIEGPVTGQADEIHTGIGWFNLATEEMEITVQPLDFRRTPLVDIEIGH